ncbi:GNAT family N-acetyltransferase [Croceitalea rosinachiae]|uniref:GNAT family protein n=1 Tax=Croceitalea rosinachiae TaxID=3075596 RepID=A0ABU3AGB7_9FLAO|nr:GNAT family protein [Croceitalea sp. F388]MDT0608158.1 GNAT family protein [Croceitalea sp. F388]
MYLTLCHLIKIGKKIKIRPLNLSDKAELAKLANNKKVWDNLRDYIPFPYKEGDAEFFINLAIKEEPKQTFGIEYKGKLSGVIGLVKQKDVYQKSAEIGYWIGELYWGNGIATKAVELIIKYGFDKLGLNRIYTGVFEYNIGSMKVLEKNGFKKEGIFKNAIFKNDKVYNEHRFYKLNEK